MLLGALCERAPSCDGSAGVNVADMHGAARRHVPSRKMSSRTVDGVLYAVRQHLHLADHRSGLCLDWHESSDSWNFAQWEVNEAEGECMQTYQAKGSARARSGTRLLSIHQRYPARDPHLQHSKMGCCLALVRLHEVKHHCG